MIFIKGLSRVIFIALLSHYTDSFTAIFSSIAETMLKGYVNSAGGCSVRQECFKNSETIRMKTVSIVDQGHLQRTASLSGKYSF